MADFIATRMYMKPLLPDQRAISGDPGELLKKARRDLMRRVKQELKQTAFSDRAKRSLSKSIRIEIKQSSLQIKATHPAFAPLLKGQKRGQMTWLKKAERPIPLIDENGKLIFRWASARSMRDGRWIHPGRKPSTFVDRAKKTSREFLREKFRKELGTSIRRSLAKR